MLDLRITTLLSEGTLLHQPFLNTDEDNRICVLEQSLKIVVMTMIVIELTHRQ